MPIAVSEAAAFARCRRALWRHKSLMLHKCSPRSRWYRDLGDYYCVDARNNIAGPRIESLEELARDLGVLRPGETVASD